MNKKFEEGDRVQLIKGKYLERPSNPLNTLGTIVLYEKGAFGISIKVMWDNGQHNFYDDNDLILALNTIYPDE